MEISATKCIKASLYEGGRTMRSLLSVGIYNKGSSERHAKLSKYRPRSQHGILIKEVSVLIIAETSMMQPVLFEHVHTIPKDLCYTC